MKKYSIPALALVLGMVAASAHGVSAQSPLGVSTNTNINASSTASANVAGASVGNNTTANVNTASSTSTNGSTSSVKNSTAKLAAVIKRSDAAITARVTSLTKLSARIAKLKHLTDAQRASLTGSVQTSIDAMNTLKAKVDGDTDLATAKTDYASITKNYRIFAVVVPSESTIAAADNAMATVTTYGATVAKLQTRVTTAKTAGKDVAIIQASLDDATAKLADAQTQGQATITAVTSLKVDGGDKTIQATNKTQLAAAVTARKAMNADIAAARKDIISVRAGLKTLKV
jgi:hypothetical protein